MALSLSGDGTLSGVDIAASGLGKVLQVVRSADTTSHSTTSDTMVDATGFDVTITPTSTTSRILIFLTCATWPTGYMHTQIADSSNNPIGTSNGVRVGMDDASLHYHQTTMMVQDTPATISAVTYKVRYRIQAGTGDTARIRNDFLPGQLYAIEVAA